MLKKCIVTVSLILIAFLGTAQESLNDFKYIIIPKSFEFSKSDDQYQLNSLTKFLFNKYGYEAYFVDELPEDLKKNRCLGLMTEVSNDEGGMFKTKLKISLKNCYDAVVMTSKIGESRKKQFDKAYTEALRDAFETFKELEYKYVPVQINENENGENKEEVELESEEEIIIVEETVIEDMSEIKAVEEIKTYETISLKAKEIKNGYLLSGNDDEVVYKVRKTTNNELFILEGSTGIIHKVLGRWMVEYYVGDVHEFRYLEIKF